MDTLSAVIFASWASDLSGLTFLILGVLAFVLAIVFRSELKDLIRRLTDFEWKEAKVRAAPATDEAPPSQPPGSSDTEATPNDAQPTDVNEAAAPSGAASRGETEDSVRSEMFSAFFARDRERGEERFQQLKGMVTDPVEGKRDEIRRLTALFMSGLETASLSSLDKWTSDSDVSWFALRMKGLCLAHAGRHQEAADVFQNAIDAVTNAADKADLLRLRSTSLTALGNVKAAKAELEGALVGESDLEAQLELWSALATAHEKADEPVLKATALHKVAELGGNDSERWFAAGYAYGNTADDGLGPMAIHCYLTALRFDPDKHWAINNLGAELSGLSLGVLGVDRYEESADKGNTLAMANMAEKYLTAGFSADAQRLIDRANQLETQDDKVATVALKIRDTRKEGEARLKDLTKSADRASSFFLTYARSHIDAESAGIQGSWAFENGTPASVSVDGDKLEILWKSGGGKHPHRRFLGSVAGRTASGQFEKQSTWPFHDDSIHWESGGDAYICFNESGDHLTMLRIHGSTFEHFLAAREASQ